MPDQIPVWLQNVGPAEAFWVIFGALWGGRWIKQKAAGGSLIERMVRLETKVDLIMAAMKLTPKD